MTVMRFACTGCGSVVSASGGTYHCPRCNAVANLSIAPTPAKGPGFGQGPRKELPKRHPVRAPAAFARNFGPQSRLCRRQRCSVPTCLETWKIEPDHYRQRSSQGHDEHTWPLCWKHHAERHALGLRPFEEKHGVSAEVIALALAQRIEAHGSEAEPCADFAELETEEEANRRAHRKGAIQRTRCAICLRLIPTPAAEVTP